MSRLVFKNRQYFIVYKSSFGAVFQETIFLAIYDNSEPLEKKVLISINDLLLKDKKVRLGLLITADKWRIQFRENRNTRECKQQHTSNYAVRFLSIDAKIPTKSYLLVLYWIKYFIFEPYLAKPVVRNIVLHSYLRLKYPSLPTGGPSSLWNVRIYRNK